MMDTSGAFCFSELSIVPLKGFEADRLRTFSMEEQAQPAGAEAVPDGSQVCAHCSKVMHLDVDTSGFYVFRCRDCDAAAPVPNLMLQAA